MDVPGRIDRRIDRQELRRLYETKEPGPVDVLNLIRFRSRASYNMYGMMMLPTLRAIGASIRWAGTHVHSIFGEPQSEELIVVRYPRIRRFIQMAMNPLYLVLANPLRVRGVKYFEASFTTPDEPKPFGKQHWILVIHYNGDDDARRRVTDIATQSGGEHVYSSREFSPISFIRDCGPTDPNPLTFKRVAFFGFQSQEDASHAFTPLTIERIDAATTGAASIQLYRRSGVKEFLPRPGQKTAESCGTHG